MGEDREREGGREGGRERFPTFHKRSFQKQILMSLSRDSFNRILNFPSQGLPLTAVPYGGMEGRGGGRAQEGDSRDAFLGRWKMEDGRWKMEDGRWCVLVRWWSESGDAGRERCRDTCAASWKLPSEDVQQLPSWPFSVPIQSINSGLNRHIPSASHHSHINNQTVTIPIAKLRINSLPWPLPPH